MGGLPLYSTWRTHRMHACVLMNFLSDQNNVLYHSPSHALSYLSHLTERSASSKLGRDRQFNIFTDCSSLSLTLPPISPFTQLVGSSCPLAIVAPPTAAPEAPPMPTIRPPNTTATGVHLHLDHVPDKHVLRPSLFPSAPNPSGRVIWRPTSPCSASTSTSKSN